MEQDHQHTRTLTAFKDAGRLASGAPWDVALAVKAAMATDIEARYLCFDDRTGAFIDLDLSGTDDNVVNRLKPATEPDEATDRPKVGRPKLGVVSKEITLLPRHWDWLARHPGGASATLRKLVDAARKNGSAKDDIRHAQAAADRFMAAMLGDQPGYEEATRALYRNDEAGFLALTRDWPKDLRDYAIRLAKPAFAQDT